MSPYHPVTDLGFCSEILPKNPYKITKNPYKNTILLKQKNRSTLFTHSFSGRPARAIENEFIRLMSGKTILDFPIQNKLTAPLRKVAAKLDDPEYQSLWTGVNFDECRQETVSELIERLGFGD